MPKLVKLYYRPLTRQQIVNASLRENISINQISNDGTDIIAFYILNDDMSMTLIWKDGAMVDDRKK
ncbi:hypothetical protein ACN9VA_03560 [Staphylococcus caprae]|uniref:hypothetical protein n=1 Tax=Staphylococcus TaxID=1279 RepID=UPI00073382C6|nr:MULTISPECIES: hypothetical protein [Staphylococcus]MBU5271252.1 hypothetical protein [Staphylococcus caprae]MDK6297109.1 hypothetical protein [Staphylococcus caprae]MDK7233623.1 hypothetical protein [Staphylococcus caprae]PNM98174.1 hypothetical protein AL529_004005 [Staphylococcus capitis]